MRHHLPLTVCLAFLLAGSSWAFIECRWDVVGTARSLIINKCLQLSVKKCDCTTSIGCPAKYYKVDLLHGFRCSAVITWCDWGTWDHDIRTVSGSSACDRYSIRKRKCCVKDHGAGTPILNLNSRYWRCMGQDSGADTQTHIERVSCPGYSTATMPLVFFAIVVVLLIVTTAIIVLRLFCRTKLTACWRRTASAMAPTQCPPPLSPPSGMAEGPPRYEEAMAQMPAPPSYDEAVEAQGQVNLAMEMESPREGRVDDATATSKASDDEEQPDEVENEPGTGEGASSSGQESAGDATVVQTTEERPMFDPQI